MVGHDYKALIRNMEWVKLATSKFSWQFIRPFYYYHLASSYQSRHSAKELISSTIRFCYNKKPKPNKFYVLNAYAGKGS